MIVLRCLAFALGALTVVTILRSAIRTVVVPRGEATRITSKTFLLLRLVYDFFARHSRSDEQRERVFARYAPTTLLTLASFWALGTILAFVPMFWSVGVHDFKESIYLSGSSITTLGNRAPTGPLESLLSYTEALIGLGIVALLISYLPTLYTLFSRRETDVVKLDVRAGSPPTALEMLTRYHTIDWIDRLDETWAVWEHWFAELEESHTSQPALVYFRSHRPNSSWITCAGAVLDTAAVSVSVLGGENHPQAAVTLRAGFMALKSIARFFGVPFDEHPEPGDQISIYKEEFMLLYDDLESMGLPVRPDREQAWRDFAGWRVNYDAPLLALCALVSAPATPWSSDRCDRFHRPTFFRPHWRIDPTDTPERSF
jgi:hypothetical protein